MAVDDEAHEDRWVLVWIGMVSAEDHDELVEVGDPTRWSSWVRRHAEEQNAVPLVWPSQDRQKSPMVKSMLCNDGLVEREGKRVGWSHFVLVGQLSIQTRHPRPRGCGGSDGDLALSQRSRRTGRWSLSNQADV